MRPAAPHLSRGVLTATITAGLLIAGLAPASNAATSTAVVASPAADPVTSAVEVPVGLVCTTATGSLNGGSALNASATNSAVVGVARGASGNTWRATKVGGVIASGASYGSATNYGLSTPVVGIEATKSGGGYWLVTSDGRVFPFGNAVFYGSLRGDRLDAPIVGMARTSDGRGYWLVASNGAVYSFGDATPFGSTVGMRLNQPIVGMAVTADGRGYWLAASDGGVFSFGDARFQGSAAGEGGEARVVAVVAAPQGGYWLVSETGSVAGYGAPTVGVCGDSASRFTAWPATVAVGGDSITVASALDLTRDLAADTTQSTFADHIGWTLEDGSSELVSASRAHPGEVVVAFGTNDWSDGAGNSGVSDYQSDVRALLADLPAGQRVLWVLPYWSALRTPITNYDIGIQADLQRLNAATTTTLAGYSNVQVLDMNAVFGALVSLVGPDGLHPTAAGATAWAEAVTRAVED